MKQEWLDGIIVTTLISIQDLMTFNYHTWYDLGIFANAAFFAFLSVRVFDSIKDERRREEEGRRELGQSCKKQKIAISKNLLNNFAWKELKKVPANKVLFNIHKYFLQHWLGGIGAELGMNG